MSVDVCNPRQAQTLGAFAFITLGCAKNEVDTDRMRALLEDAGFVEADAADADVILVNTCSFLTVATQESIEATLTLAQANAPEASETPIIMCGCVPSRYGSDLAGELPEVAAFVPVEEEDDIVRVVARVLGTSVGGGACAQGMLRTVQAATAYVKISDGCDRWCTFCAIPNIRGRYRSRTEGEICAEIRGLMEGGVREVVLIGQDTGVWGVDFEGQHKDLAWLLERVAEVVRPYGGWVRVLYLQPEGMTDRLIAALRDIDVVLPYMDIPIQHCSERILSLMGRTGSQDELRTLFDRLRGQIPGMVLRTTGLVGFPTETDDEFEELLSFIQEVGFDYTSVFAYSQEDGTEAALMEGQVEEAVKLERMQDLVDLTEQLGFAATAQHVGETVEVIIDGIEEYDGGMELVGHAWFQAPDSDGAVHIAAGEAAVGDKITCKIVDSFCYELEAVALPGKEG